MHDRVKRVRILIADDHEAIREGLRRIVEHQPAWTVCGTATTGDQAIERTEQLKPDVVVLDMGMPGLQTMDVVHRIKRSHPHTEIIIFTGRERDEMIPELFEAGAKSFILKSEESSQLIEAIRSACRGKPFFTTKVSGKLFASMMARGNGQSAMDPAPNHLTTREREVIQLLGTGKSNKEVASALGISIRTAETHRAHLLDKLGVDSLAALVRYAVRNAIIEA